MDFTLTDEQQAIADLAHRILSEQLPPERLRELEQTDAWFADDVWAELGKADLLGIALPEADGGGGYGILEACLIAEQIGRTVAPVPYLSSIVGAGDADRRVRHRRAAQAAAARRHRRSRDARPSRSTSPPTSPCRPCPPRRPPPTATGGGSTARSRSWSAPTGPPPSSSRPAPPSPPRRCSWWRPSADGVHLTREVAVSGEPQWTVRLDGVRVDGDALLGDAAAGRRDRRVDHRPPGRRRLRHPDRRVRGGPRHHRPVRLRARAVREQARHLPGRRPAGRRRLHRHRGHPPHRASRPPGGSPRASRPTTS